MIIELVYVAVNKDDEIQWVYGFSSKTRYFKTETYIKKHVKYHNTYFPEDPWRVAKCKLVEVEND
jgi:hypothetical protein